MRKKINHINFDTRDSYGKHNSNVLSSEFLKGGYDVPLWGTENQFENNGMKVQKGSILVYLIFKTEEENANGNADDSGYAAGAGDNDGDGDPSSQDEVTKGEDDEDKEPVVTS